MIRFARFRPACLWLVPVTGLAGSAQAQPAVAPASCPRDVFMSDAARNQSMRRLQEAGAAPRNTQCSTWRAHVDVLKQAEVINQRCLDGPERAGRLGDIRQSRTEFQDAIRDRCKGI
jgi:hypothetical protein